MRCITSAVKNPMQTICIGILEAIKYDIQIETAIRWNHEWINISNISINSLNWRMFFFSFGMGAWRFQ